MICAPVVITWAEFAAADQFGGAGRWCPATLGHECSRRYAATPWAPSPSRARRDLPELALMMCWSSIVPVDVVKVRHSFVSLPAGVLPENISVSLATAPRPSPRPSTFGHP